MKANATDEYMKAQTLVNDLCEVLAGALEDHMINIDPGRVNFGHVGDLNHVADLLGETIAFLRNEG